MSDLHPVCREPNDRPGISVWLTALLLVAAVVSIPGGPTPALASPPKIRGTALTSSDKLAIARALCDGAAIERSRGGLRCRCPAYTGAELGLLTIPFETSYRAALSKPGADELLIEVRGCESGASSNLTYASRALLRKTGASWRRLFYRAGAPGRCKLGSGPNGTSLALCAYGHGNMGLYGTTLVLRRFVASRGRRVREVSTELCSIWTDANHRQHKTEYAGRRKVYYNAITQFGFTAARGPRPQSGLTVRVRVDSEIVCLEKRCPNPGRERFSLLYHVDGKQITLSPSSRPVLRRLEKRFPEH